MILEIENICDSCIKRLSVRRLRTDNAKEFISNSMNKWLQRKGIIRENSSAYSPESNGKDERLNRTLLDIARAMMQDMNHVPGRQRLWAEAISTAIFIGNRPFSTACNDPTKTPFEIITGKRPNVRFLRCFASKAFVHVPKAKTKGKLEARAEVGYLVGFANGNTYKVYLPHKKTVIISRDVMFEELCQQKPRPSRDYGSANLDPLSVPFSIPKEDEDTHPSPESDISPFGVDWENRDDENDHANSDPLTYYTNRSRSGRTVRQPDRYTDTSAMIALNVRMGNEDTNVPTSYKEAM